MIRNHKNEPKMKNDSAKNNLKDAMNLMVLGYRDYIGARFLLNNDYVIQGVTLASTAVEKYLKAILVAHGYSRQVHIEQWKKMKSLLSIKV